MRIGSLFSGAGGLDLAVEAVFGGEVTWQSELDKAASKVLAYRFPCAPNLGDITQINWKTVEPIDVLCGGFPCQDVSAAGRRAGIKDGTRSGLWSVFADAIEALQPEIVIIENVRGLLSARAHRHMEPTNGTVGDQSSGPVLRAAGAVLGDLADLGYDAQWTTAAASDIGAPHQRARVFILAADTERGRRQRWPLQQRRPSADASGDSPLSVDLLPTPRSSDCFGAGLHGDGGMDLRTTVTLLPKPTTEPQTGNGRARNLGNEVKPEQWGKYAPAIKRWETITRPAPAPTEPNKNNNPRLSAPFAEWLMGWPAGWVTDPDIGLSRNDQLRIIGNGVVPQQAIAALTHLIGIAAGTHTHTHIESVLT